MKSGWTYETLGVVTEIVNGGTPKSGISEFWDGGIPWITPKDMGRLTEYYTSDTSRTISETGLAKSSARLIPENSVILSTRAPIGHLVVNQVSMAFNQGCRGLVPSNRLITGYLFYFLKMNVDHLNDLGTGATFKELSKTALASVTIPLPPLPEQRRIVGILDEAFAGIDSIIANTEQNLSNARELFESYLNNAFTQKTDGWVEKKLGDLLSIQNGYAFNSKQFSPEGDLALIRIRDLKQGYDTETRYSGEYDEKYIVRAGDYLIGMDGEFTCYEWKGEAALLNQRVCRLEHFSDSLDARFLFYGINKYLKAIEDVTAYTTVKHLSAKQITEISLPLPPLSEQKRIVAALDRISAETQRLEALYQQKLDHLTELKQSILQKAFSGELTKAEKVA